MTRLNPDPNASTVALWTYKEGLLSKMAHDLKIRIDGWKAPLERENGSFKVDVVIPVDGLHVAGQVKGDQVTPMADKDHADIDKSMRTKVLDAAKFPEIRYEGAGAAPTSGEMRVDGKLTLKGKTQPLPVTCKVSDGPEGTRVQGEVRFQQTQFGVTPFSALMGTLKVKDEVRVTWDLLYPKA